MAGRKHGVMDPIVTLAHHAHPASLGRIELAFIAALLVVGLVRLIRLAREVVS
jgi:hypothetical protein